MAIDIEKIKAELDKYNNPDKYKRKSGENSLENLKLFTLNPKDSQASAVIKLVPYKFNEDDPFIRMWFHYNIPNYRSILCSKAMKNEPCDICDFSWALYDKYKQNPNDQLKKAFSDLIASERIFAPVVQMDTESAKEVKMWGFSTNIHHQLLKDTARLLESKISINDPNASPEYMYTVVSAKKAQSRFNKPGVEMIEDGLNRRISKLAGSAQEIAQILSTCPNIHDIYSYLPADSIKIALNNYVENLGGQNRNHDDKSIGTEKFNPPAPSVSNNNNPSNTDDVINKIGADLDSILNKKS